jgi:hypothetical protein
MLIWPPMLVRPHLTRPLFSYEADFLASWEHYQCCEVYKRPLKSLLSTSFYVSAKDVQIISLELLFYELTKARIFLFSTLFNTDPSAAPQISLCLKMFESNPGQRRLWHWLSDALHCKKGFRFSRPWPECQ